VAWARRASEVQAPLGAKVPSTMGQEYELIEAVPVTSPR
jgi:hypothetical protein